MKILKELLHEITLIRKELHDIKRIMELTNHLQIDYLTDENYEGLFARTHAGQFKAGKIVQ